MLKLVPNIVVLDYLTAAGELKPDVEQKAKRFMLSGYQRQLSYRHLNGSFSSFGKLDRSGSTWLTAFVVKSFWEAKKYIEVDEAVLEKALVWLNTTQAADGSFPEVGQVSHEVMQGGKSKNVALTAYTVTAFLVVSVPIDCTPSREFLNRRKYFPNLNSIANRNMRN